MGPMYKEMGPSMLSNILQHECAHNSLSCTCLWNNNPIFSFQMRLENMKAGRKGNLNVATEVANWIVIIYKLWKEFVISMFLIASPLDQGISSRAFSSYGWGAESKRGYFGVPKGTCFSFIGYWMNDDDPYYFNLSEAYFFLRKKVFMSFLSH